MSDFTVAKYRLYPFHDQELELLRQLEEARFLWNYALEQRLEARNKDHKALSVNEQKRSLTQWREHDAAGVGSLLCHVAQDVLQRLDDAFSARTSRVLKNRKAGRVHFKREGEMVSLTYPDGDGSAAVVDGRNGTKRLHLAKLADIPIKLHRPLPIGKLGPVTVKREGAAWFVELCYRLDTPAEPSGLPQAPIGIDLGLKAVVALSDGTTVAPLQAYRSGQKRLRRAQKKLSRMVKGSHNWWGQVERVQRCHTKVRHQRNDFNHKLTTRIVHDHDLVAFENLNVSAMVRNGHLSKSISDVGWSQITTFTAYKERRRSGRCVLVNARGTTQECSRCGTIPSVPLTLGDRVYTCATCGMVEDRDVNAARNILSRSRAIVGEGIPEVTPAERRRTSAKTRKGRKQVRSLRQEPQLGIAMPSGGPSGPSLEGGNV
jgi:putative transposase